MKKTEQISEILTRGVNEVLPKGQLEKQLKTSKKLRVKLGIDPTSPNIHIGRAVVLHKLRSFQELGHTVVFIVGDFTGVIGDTSDKEAERPMLSHADVSKNMKDYFNQAFKVLDKNLTETYYNSQWLKKLGFAEIGHMADAFGLHEFSSRDNIRKRLKAGKRVSLRELLYPLMQGYDSVHVKADVELGGTDQKFNMLAGRTIQELHKQKPQAVMTVDLIEGTDGRKMSSSWGNTVNLTDEPDNMFGKIMSVPDSLIKKYFLVTTRLPVSEIESIIKSNVNPRDQKIVLAETVTAQYHDQKKASQAKQNFISQFSQGNIPDKIEQFKIEGEQSLVELLVQSGMVASKGEVRRLIKQNGLKLDGSVVTDETFHLDKKSLPIVAQIGKRRFIKFV